MPGIYPESCRYCGDQIAFVPTSTTRERVPLDADPVPTVSVPAQDSYALARPGTASLISDIHRPPESCYRRHRCPQYRDSAARQEAEQMMVGNALDWWQEQIDAHVYPAAPPSIPDEVRRLA